MALKLFEHNLEAYDAAVRMLDTTGKAAVIHPTGTGKSFIGFKLAEDNPNKHIIWLTPSEYIVKTQLENLKKEGGAELEKYQKRVQRARSKAVRAAGEKYLEALRRALEKADGLDTIFCKHMEDKKGKYILFCANGEHMQEMIEMVPEWFGKVDKNPHIYSAYSSNPETSKAFAEFKADKSNHLKLLFCIDMLNEGIHVDDISGVILLRPTVSPIIYKQQIGRALAAGKKKNTVIFDIVLNFENLYSISDIKEEMNEAIRFYQSTGEEYEIVNDTFTVIDEVRDCRQLFNELERSLSASWKCMYNAAKEYYKEHGDLMPAQKYTNDDGYRLGQWITAQRIAYSNGNLSSSRILRLDIPVSYITESGIKLRYWIDSRKKAYKKGTLDISQIKRLEQIGIV
ncbi:MAG: Helicase associated domain protein [Candidatus Ornithomonoglobus sp.]